MMKLGKEFFIGLGIAAFLSFMIYSVTSRKYEAQVNYVKPGTMVKQDPKNENWKNAYPRQYSSYMEMMTADPKDYKSNTDKPDELKKNPNLVILWAGYGFAKDYKKARGHVFAVEDISSGKGIIKIVTL